MKKEKEKVILSILILSIIITSSAIFNKVYAADQIVSFVGSKDVETEKVQTLYIKIANNEAIGVIEGTLIPDSNTQITEFKSNSSDWALTYNEKNGKFNSYCAKGTTESEVLKISFKVKAGADKASITIGDIELTTTSYRTITQESLTQDFTIKKASVEESNTKNEITIVKDKNDVNSTNATTIIPQLGAKRNIIIAVIGIACFSMLRIWRKTKKYNMR